MNKLLFNLIISGAVCLFFAFMYGITRNADFYNIKVVSKISFILLVVSIILYLFYFFQFCCTIPL